MWHHVSLYKLYICVQLLITLTETSITLLNILPGTMFFEKFGTNQTVTNGLRRARKHM